MGGRSSAPTCSCRPQGVNLDVFVHNVEGMAEELEDLNAVYIHGGVETDEFAGLSTDEIYDTNDESVGEEQTREDVIRRFKEDPSCWALVANPLRGRRYQFARRVPSCDFLGSEFDATKFMQVIDRIHRYGVNDDGEVICATTQTSIEIVYCPGTIDRMCR